MCNIDQVKNIANLLFGFPPSHSTVCKPPDKSELLGVEPFLEWYLKEPLMSNVTMSPYHWHPTLQWTANIIMCLHKQFSQEATDIEFTEILEGRKESVSHLNDVGSDEDGDALPGHQPEGAHQVEEEQVEAKACLKVKPNLKISKRKTKLTKKFENLKFLKKVKKNSPRSLLALGWWAQPKEAEAVAAPAWCMIDGLIFPANYWWCFLWRTSLAHHDNPVSCYLPILLDAAFIHRTMPLWRIWLLSWGTFKSPRIEL